MRIGRSRLAGHAIRNFSYKDNIPIVKRAFYIYLPRSEIDSSPLKSTIGSLMMEKIIVSDQVTPAERSHDAEKAVSRQAVYENDQASISDKDSVEFQGGVRRVRAITSSWSTKTLILVFVL
jgi:hypothetical protein